MGQIQHIRPPGRIFVGAPFVKGQKRTDTKEGNRPNGEGDKECEAKTWQDCASMQNVRKWSSQVSEFFGNSECRRVRGGEMTWFFARVRSGAAVHLEMTVSFGYGPALFLNLKGGECMRFLLTVLIMTILSGACGDDSNNSPAKGKLAKADAKAFASWKSSLVKACDATSAFTPGGNSTDTGIDVRLLMEKTGGRLQWEQDGQRWLLDIGSRFSGESKSQYRQSAEVNGKVSSQVDAEFTRSGSHCQASLFGKKEYDTYVVPAIDVLLHSAAPADKEVSSYIKVYPVSGANLTSIDELNLLAVAAAALTPSEAALKVLAAGLGMSPSQATLFVRPSGLGAAGAIATTLDSASNFIGSPNGTHMVSHAVAKALMEDGREVPASMWFRELTWSFPDIEAPAAGVWKVDFSLSVRKGQDNVSFVKMTEAAAPTLLESSAERAVSCMQGREWVLLGISNLIGSTPFDPSYAQAYGPCDVFVTDGNTLLDFSDYRTWVVGHFANTRASRQVKYQGWDAALRELALHQWSAQQPIRDLDPDGGAPIVAGLHNEALSMAELVKTYPALAAELNTLLAMGMDWTFRGDFVDQAARERMAEALANIIDPFVGAFRSLVSSLSGNPMAQDKSLAFALSITDSYKQQARTLLSKGEELETSVLANLLADVVRNEVTTEQIAVWLVTADALLVFKKQELVALKKESLNYAFERHFTTLLQRAVEEGWTSTQFEELAKLMDLARHIRPYCGDKHTVSERADCLSFEMKLTSKENGILAPKFEGRYADMAQSLRRYYDAQAESFDPVKSDVMDAFVDPIWAACAQPEFSTKRKNLERLLADYAKADFFKKSDLRSQIRDALAANCEVR